MIPTENLQRWVYTHLNINPLVPLRAIERWMAYYKVTHADPLRWLLQLLSMKFLIEEVQKDSYGLPGLALALTNQGFKVDVCVGMIHDVFLGHDCVGEHVWLLIDDIFIADSRLGEKLSEKTGIQSGAFPVWATGRITYQATGIHLFQSEERLAS